MIFSIHVTTTKKPGILAVGIGIGTRHFWVGFCGLWIEVEPGVPWWRTWLFDNRSEPGKGGALYGMVRWTTG